MAKRVDFDGGFEIVLPRGRALGKRLKPGVLVVTYEGMVTEELIRPSTAYLESAMDEVAQLRLFVDASDLATYTTGFRKGWADWLGKHGEQIGELHMLVRSRAVKMGVRLVNPLIGDILVAHTNKEDFEAEIQAAISRS